MSDYLGNLAAGALNLGQRIEPRLTSRYESTAATRPFANPQSTVAPLETPAIDYGLEEDGEAVAMSEKPRPTHPPIPSEATAAPAPHLAQPAHDAPTLPPLVKQRRAFIDEAIQPPAPLRSPRNEPPAPESYTTPAPSNPSGPDRPKHPHSAEHNEPWPQERQPASPPSQLPRPENLPFSPPSENSTPPAATPATRAAAEERPSAQEHKNPTDGPHSNSAPVRVIERIIETESVARGQVGEEGEGQATPKARLLVPLSAFETLVEQTSAAGRIIAQPQITFIPPAPQETAAAPARQQEAGAPTPTIHVSIGRIEVRASLAPSQPPARKAATNAAPSLEEYLRARNGDRR